MRPGTIHRRATPPRRDSHRETQVGRLRRRSRGGQTLNGRSRHPRLGGRAGQHRVKPRQGRPRSSPILRSGSRRARARSSSCPRRGTIDSTRRGTRRPASRTRAPTGSLVGVDPPRPTVESDRRHSLAQTLRRPRLPLDHALPRPARAKSRRHRRSTDPHRPLELPFLMETSKPTSRRPPRDNQSTDENVAKPRAPHRYVASRTRHRLYAHTDKKGLRLPPRWAEPWRRRSPG